ncbi:hypothetical protein B0H63DRAFT_518170 [Podospora didyma]|uniref:Uncharacterized protein n=1 Tax=Podospora didyma TaxID=330526 RepID=A0AAE0P837_9PEZI|nr:hypothetical protein B0H63DRAFT_518170 [Podospora didyma]
MTPKPCACEHEHTYEEVRDVMADEIRNCVLQLISRVEDTFPSECCETASIVRLVVREENSILNGVMDAYAKLHPPKRDLRCSVTLHTEKDLCAWDTDFRSTLDRHSLTKYINEDTPDLKEGDDGHQTWRRDRQETKTMLCNSTSSTIYSSIVHDFITGHDGEIPPRQIYQRVHQIFETSQTLGQILVEYANLRRSDFQNRAKYLERLRRCLLAHGMPLNNKFHVLNLLNGIRGTPVWDEYEYGEYLDRVIDAGGDPSSVWEAILKDLYQLVATEEQDQQDTS